MKRLLLPLLLLLLALAGCGSRTVTVTHTATQGCQPAPGTGTMGVCVPPPKIGASAPVGASARLIPDVSEYQGCGLHSEAIVRVYEAGDNSEDSRAPCHAAELHHLHAWAAGYFFARPPGYNGRAPSCAGQVARAVGISRSLGLGPVLVVDAEVSLPGGFVRCVMAGISHDGDTAVEYTCPGCGVEKVAPTWIADYPFRPAGRWVAHQFSDNYTCRGLTHNDCSIDEGIVGLGVKPKPTKPKTHTQLRAELAQIDRLLGAYSKKSNPYGHNCQHPPYRHAYSSARYNHACAVWAAKAKADRKALS